MLIIYTLATVCASLFEIRYASQYLLKPSSVIRMYLFPSMSLTWIPDLCTVSLQYIRSQKIHTCPLHRHTYSGCKCVLEEEEDLARRKQCLPAGKLVSRPGAGFLVLLGLIYKCQMEAGDRDKRWGSFVVVGGSVIARTA